MGGMGLVVVGWEFDLRFATIRLHMRSLIDHQ